MLINLVCFVSGLLIMWCLNVLMALGHSVVLLKQTQHDCALLFTVCHQGLMEVLELKYLSMQEAKRSEQNIIAQRHIDQVNIQSIQGAIIRNYINVFPESYSHVLQFSNWRELEDYVNKAVQNNKEKR